MPDPIYAPTVYATAAALASRPGPTTTSRYAYVVSLDKVFQWSAASALTTDNVTVIGTSSGGAGQWLAVRAPHRGADLTNADVTLQVSGDTWRVLPVATLTGPHTCTLGTTQAVAGDVVEITRLDVTANTYTIINGGPAAGNLAVFPVSQRAFIKAQFDGTNWVTRHSAQML